MPKISDIETTIKILKALGCKISKTYGKIIVDSGNVKKYEIPDNLMQKMRSSVVIAGALLGRFKKVIFSYPGDCDIWWIHRTSIR